MRTKNTFKTVIYGVLLTAIIAIIGIFKTKVLLHYMGDDNVAVYQLFSQIFVYLSLMEGGISSAMIFYLYDPLRKKNYEDISQKFRGIKKYFNMVGIITIVSGFVACAFIMLLLKGNSLGPWYVRGCLILFIIASAVPYFTMAHDVLYEAEQLTYKKSNLNHLLTIVKGLIEMLLAYLGMNLMILMVSFLVLSIIKALILLYISRKDHKYLVKTDVVDSSFKKEANNLMVNKISNVIFENIDILLLSSMVNPLTVVIYTAYHQITNMIVLMIKRFNTALIPGIGDMLLDSEDNKNARIFNEVNSLMFYIGLIICIPLFFVLNQFISLWYGDKYVVDLFTSLAFILVLFITIITIPLDVFIKASGNFKAVRNWSIYQSIVNLTLSIVLVSKYGIIGVLLGTLIAFITGNFIGFPKIIYEKVLKEKVYKYYWNVIKYMIVTIPCYFILLFITQYLHYTNILNWLMNGFILAVTSFIIISVYFYLIKSFEFIGRFKRLLKRKA